MRRTRTDQLLIDAFGPHVYLVGGAVRDALRQQFHHIESSSKDKDYLIVGHSFDAVRGRLTQIGRTVGVGASFSVLKLTVPGEQTVDITLPQADRSLNGFPGPDTTQVPSATLTEDQRSRDFTMNAVSLHLSTSEIHEFPGAVEDIRNKRIRAINGRRTFVDDPLRLVRAAQFAARFDFSIDSPTFSAMEASAALISDRKHVAVERIGEELTKLLLLSPRPSVGFRILQQTRLLGRVVPGLELGDGVEQNRFHAYDVLGHNLATVDASRATLESRWAALLHDIGKPAARSASKVAYGYTFHNHEHIGEDMARQVLRDLRYSNEMTERVSKLVGNHMYTADATLSDSTIRRFINRIDPALLDDQFHLRHCDKVGCGLEIEGALQRNTAFQDRVYEILNRRQPRTVRDLAVNGHDVIRSLVSIGYRSHDATPGPAVGRILRQLRELVLDDPEANTRERLFGQIATIVSGWETGQHASSAAASVPGDPRRNREAD